MLTEQLIMPCHISVTLLQSSKSQECSLSDAAGEGANTVLAGVMRGCGRQKIGAAINLVTYWGIGLPASIALAFYTKLGPLGLWTGLACTASIQALLMTLTVWR